jgi:hypothetical protein
MSPPKKSKILKRKRTAVEATATATSSCDFCLQAARRILENDRVIADLQRVIAELERQVNVLSSPKIDDKTLPYQITIVTTSGDQCGRTVRRFEKKRIYLKTLMIAGYEIRVYCSYYHEKYLFTIFLMVEGAHVHLTTAWAGLPDFEITPEWLETKSRLETQEVSGLVDKVRAFLAEEKALLEEQVRVSKEMAS